MANSHLDKNQKKFKYKLKKKYTDRLGKQWEVISKFFWEGEPHYVVQSKRKDRGIIKIVTEIMVK